MMTPVQAMLWQIWRGWRWGLIVGWAYLLLAAVVAGLLPDIFRHTHLGDVTLPKAGQLLAFPCTFILIYLLVVFSITGADIKERGYWSTMFVLPARTRTLVAWPMIWGCLTLGSGWLFVAGLILRPTGNAVPLVWPVAALAAGLTLLQALSWIPVAQNWLSIAIAVPLFLALATVIALLAVFKVPEPIATGIFLGLLPLTCTAGLHGVALARRGDRYDWGTWNRLVAWIAAWRKPAEHPFHSAARAQFWFECRSFAWTLPLLIAVLVPFFAIVFVFDQESGVALAWKQMIIFLLIPAITATIIGSQLGNASFPFLAARPISSVALVRSKFAMALVSALAACIPVLVVVPLFFLRPGFLESVRQAARAAGEPKAAMILFMAVVLPVALTWKGLAESLWITLPGRAWLINAFGFCVSVLFCVVFPFGLWVSFHPEIQVLLWSMAPWFVGLLLTVKLVIAAWVVSALVRSRLVTYSAAVLMIGGWGLVVAGLWLIVVWLIPGQLLSAGGALAVVVLFVPFSRLAGASLALEWNRHR
ncbi:MAG: hypothetical protein ABSG53_11490 [Thermoguttaceae bacterium]|jgi:hypothetical protein